MKRQRASRDDDGTYPYRPLPHIYSLQPIESTIVVDMNGNYSANSGGFPNQGLGYANDIPIATSIRGAKSLQYDDAIFQNDFYTHTYANSLIGLAVTYIYQDLAVSTETRYCSAILPLFVARGKRVISTSDTGVILDYSDTQYLGTSQQDLLGKNMAYELNLRFAGTSDSTNWPANMSNTICLTSNGPTDLVGKNYFPLWNTVETRAIFTGGVPIRFYQLPTANGNGGQLAVAQNQSVTLVDPVNYSYEIHMNFVSIRNNMTAPWFGQPITNRPTFTFFPRSGTLGDSRGWLGQGPHVFGVGNWNSNISTYVDDYISDNGAALLAFSTGVDTYAPSYAGLLAQLTTLSYKKSFLLSPRTLGFCPSRYYLVCSKAITRNQRIPFITNSSSKTGTKSKACMGIIYHLPEDPNVNQDMQYTDKEAVIGMKSNENRDSLDLEVIDEWGKNLETLDVSSSLQYAYLKSLEQAQNSQPPGYAQVPAVFLPLNPLPTINASGEPLCGFQNCNENGFCLSANPAANNTVGVGMGPNNNALDLSIGYEYMYPVTSKMTHFIRVLGLNQ